MTTGVVTIPKRGIYNFVFAGTANSRAFYQFGVSTVCVSLRLNGSQIPWTPPLAIGSSLSLRSTLELNQGDIIYLTKDNMSWTCPGQFRPANEDLNCQFCGWLVEEDLVL